MSFPFQNAYPINMPIGVPGRIADNCFKNNLSPIAAENIYAARGVCKSPGQDYVVNYPRVNQSVNVFSADLITGNTVNATVNGVAITPVVFATSHLATMNAIAAEIAALPNIASAVVGGANNRTITIMSDNGTSITVTGFLVTGGASQATVTTTDSAFGAFFGVSMLVYNKMNVWNPSNDPEIAGQEPYYTGDPVPVLTMGRIYVVPETVVTAESAVYVRFTGNGLNQTLGLFRGDADSATCQLIPATSAKWREGNGTVGGIAVLELTLS
jgi:hypothetical protein